MALSNGATTSTQLMRFAKKNNIPLVGCFDKSELKQIDNIYNNCGYIINLGHNTHWTSLYIKNKEIAYFDSFGQPYCQEINDFIKKFKFKNIIWADNDLQLINESWCGSYDLDWIKEMSNKKKSLIKNYNIFLSKYKNRNI